MEQIREAARQAKLHGTRVERRIPMNAMLISDLAIMRKNLLQLFGVCLIVGVGMAYGTGSLIVATACISSMVPFMYLFNVAAYDELGGW